VSPSGRIRAATDSRWRFFVGEQDSSIRSGSGSVIDTRHAAGQFAGRPDGVLTRKGVCEFEARS